MHLKKQWLYLRVNRKPVRHYLSLWLKWDTNTENQTSELFISG